MKIKVLLLIALMLGSTAFAQQGTKDEPVGSKRVNNTLGICMMGKTMQCNGISMSYLASEQGKMGFAFGAEYDREYMLGKTPLGLVTGIRMEYSRPYANSRSESPRPNRRDSRHAAIPRQTWRPHGASALYGSKSGFGDFPQDGCLGSHIRKRQLYLWESA